MAKNKKTLSEKEMVLHNIIADAKKKLAKLQDKKKNDIGELACKHGLHQFDLNVLGEAFQKISIQLSSNNKA